MMIKKNDKSSLIGLLLMGAILIIFNTFFFETAPQEAVQETETEIKNSDENIGKNTEEANNNTSPEQISNPIITEKTDEQEFILENDSIKLVLSSKGGEIKSVELKKYKTFDGRPLELFDSEDSKFNIYGGGVNSENEDFSLQSKSENTITLRHTINENTFIEYNYSLKEDQYLVDFSIKTEGFDNIATRDNEIWMEWKIAAPQTEKSKTNQEQYTGFYFQESYSKDVDYVWDNDEKEKIDVDLSWIAFKQQFFSTIISSSNNFKSGSSFQVSKNEDKYIKTLSLETRLDDKENEFNYEIYFGPNDYKKLKEYNKSYEEIIPLGWGIFGWVNRVIVINIFDFLRNSAGIKNYGLIILILTLIIKLTLSPLTYKSYLSQAKMKVLKPEIDKITEKHKEKDPMKAQKETMSLYRKAGVNPMGGCLPMLVQFPILIAMFRFFPASIELRQKSFLWADDLSSYDSIYDLGFNIPMYGDHISLFTLLMTVSTLIYTHMNSQMTSTQMPGMKWMMYLMPIMFLGFFNNYAAALSYYYFLANVFTFSQMYFMRRFVDDNALLAQIEENKKKPAKKKSKFQKKLEEMQKKQEQQLKNRKKK
ncbi:MAG: membrane protein insertase YidC [Flavobacteriales bacterium]|nr:membrane protein insertase YidC [Flavobacteriales bacterium]